MPAAPAIYLLCAWNRQPWPARDMARALACLPPAMRQEVAALRRWQDRQGRLQGRLLLRAGLARLGRRADLSSWRRGASGKPELSRGAAQFSISHTAGLTLCAFSLGQPLGVDVERWQPLERQELAMVFSPAELASMEAAADPQRELLRLWTAKEAVLKAAGVGLLGKPEEVEVLGPSVCLEGRCWCLKEVDLGPEHVGYLASLADLAGQALRGPLWLDKDELLAASG